ncbi:salicylate hydroxylase [Xylaria sp. FL0043]|nr:salicylate hydroxylase [Xylaria sp. FL0043]
MIGGGLAGATLANALVRELHLEIHVFESASEFSERGAAVGLGINAQLALNQVLPTATALLGRAGAVPLNSSRTILGSGPEAGKLIFDLAESDPGKVVHRASLLLVKLALDQSDPSRYSQWEHKSTPTYAKQHVCLVGDAAHATTPWQGSGTGLAIEDAMVLGALLAEISSSKDIESAFRAYDEVRRPRCQQVIDSSRETGRIFCGQSGLQADKLRGLLAPRWDFIFGLDMEAHKQDALAKMREIQMK